MTEAEILGDRPHLEKPKSVLTCQRPFLIVSGPCGCQKLSGEAAI
jgi:hypothetical protein